MHFFFIVSCQLSVFCFPKILNRLAYRTLKRPESLLLYEAVVLAVFGDGLFGELQFLGEGGEAYGRHVFVEEAPPVAAGVLGIADGDVGALIDVLVEVAALEGLFFYEADRLVALLVEHAVVAFAQEGEGVLDEESLEVDAELDVLFHG